MMHIATGRSFSFSLLAALVGLVCVPSARAANWYVDAAAAGSHNGTSWANAWTSFSQISQASLAGGDVVWVKSGTYDERFTITKGGSSASSRINYVGLPNSSGNRPVLRGVNGGSYSYIAFINFEITHTGSANSYDAIALTSGGGWLIQDNYIHNTYADGIRVAYGSTSNNNIIRHNSLDHVDWLSLGNNTACEGRNISVEGNHNLIEYNTIGYGLDRIKAYGVGNVIRNNYDSGTGTAETDYTKTSPYPFHIDTVQIDPENNVISSQVLVDRNFAQNNLSASGNGHFVIVQDTLGNGGFKQFIVRFNVVAHFGEAFSIMQQINDTWFYNNTVVDIFNALYNNQPACTWNSPAGNTSRWINVSFDNCPDMASTPNIIDTSNRPTSFSFDYGHRYAVGAANSLPSGTHNVGGASAPSVDPVFTNSGADNYTIQGSSPLKGAGGPVTTASAAGTNSTSLTVAAANGLFDGWGIADADWIKIGASGSYVQIASINYSTNVVTLSAARSWSSGDPVFVKGMEDVGAQPSAYATSFTVTNTSPALVAGTNTFSASVDHPDAVRKVEYLVDGLPVGEAYSAPYYVSYVADSSSHTVTARAYAAWASQTLVSESQATGAVVAPSNAKTSINAN